MACITSSTYLSSYHTSFIDLHSDKQYYEKAVRIDDLYWLIPFAALGAQ